MKKSYFLSAILCFAVHNAFAGDIVPISVTGRIVAGPCEVASDSINKTVDLNNGKKLTPNMLNTAGETTDWVPFDINLINCPDTTKKALMTLSGTADDTYPDDMYKNSGANAATNIAIQLQTSTGEQAGNGKVLSGDILNKAYSYHMKARVYSKGVATAGKIASVVTVSFTYQ
ncbi:fimbrial protein [Atlantibacter subterranea]|uniref:Fimbrial protein n=1 Tax=Atlantibacter subterraneus TaxID=255519 RepID=A0ABU4DW90_9ENTR|nr:fimbrial protein [Atlantibacter subterranea]MDV7021134.1 fimbrial protein [Atlantibacter subterranea]MDZ5664768.1 fimbrial protein [Atlantibacter hermannii]